MAVSRRVVDNPALSRYEIYENDEPAGFAAYQKADRLIVFTHTEVEPRFEGRGIGADLVRQALDQVRTSGLPVLALCPFVHQWMARHPDYSDMDYRRPHSRVTD